MEQPSFSSRRREEPDSSLREWSLRAQISRENTRSRRFSGSHIRSFREDARSFRSNIAISSTASSPGYPFKEEIDPSTYSFTTALKALQARSGYCNSWECLSPDGFALNSKWNDAEKYICNPLSGEVPMECLSAKTLSGRSFRHLANRITMSAPLVYSNPIPRHIYTKPYVVPTREDDTAHFPIKENKMEGTTRDAGTQSTPTHELCSRSTSPTISTPSIVERSLKRCEAEGEDSSSDNTKSKAKVKVQAEAEEKEERRKEGEEEEKARKRDCDKEESKKDKDQTWKCSRRRQGNGCLFWMGKRQKEKHVPRKKNPFLLSLEGCRIERRG